MLYFFLGCRYNDVPGKSSQSQIGMPSNCDSGDQTNNWIKDGSRFTDMQDGRQIFHGLDIQNQAHFIW